MTTLIIIYGLTGVAFTASLIQSRQKTKRVLKVALMSFGKTGASLLTVLGIVGLTLGILTPEKISALVGADAGFLATIGAAVAGAVTLIPSLVAFPLAGSLLRAGASVMTVSAFITTLVMVGFATFPMEMKVLGRKFALLRNALGFLSALVIAAFMGVIL